MFKKSGSNSLPIGLSPGTPTGPPRPLLKRRRSAGGIEQIRSKVRHLDLSDNDYDQSSAQEQRRGRNALKRRRTQRSRSASLGAALGGTKIASDARSRSLSLGADLPKLGITRPYSYVYPEPDEHGMPCMPPSAEHHVADDALVENEELQIWGETEIDASSSWSSPSDDADTLPIRVLSAFEIYDMSTSELIDPACLYHKDKDSSFGASGIVVPYLEPQGRLLDDDDEDESGDGIVDGQLVELSKILELNIHHVDDDGNLDKLIYIKTNLAWYILERPSPAYQPYYAQFFARHRALQAVTRFCLRKKTATYEELAYYFQSVPADVDEDDDDHECRVVLGRSLTFKDVDDFFVKSHLGELAFELGLEQVPAIMALAIFDDARPRQRRHRKAAIKQRKKASSNVEKQVLEHRNKTQVTERVHALANKLFAQSHLALDPSTRPRLDIRAQDQLNRKVKDFRVHPTDPKMVRLHEPVGTSNRYMSVLLDSELYKAGHTVMVIPEPGRKKAVDGSFKTSNSFANSMWFAMIHYFLKRGGQKKAHVQWFVHGSQTVLGEIAHPNVLFLMEVCDDIPVESIYSRFDYAEWTSLDHEPEESAGQTRRFFSYRNLYYLEDSPSFVERTDTEIDLAEGMCKDCPACTSCGLAMMHSKHWKLTDDGFELNGTAYHIYDWVYLRLGDPDNSQGERTSPELDQTDFPSRSAAFIYTIAQITGFASTNGIASVMLYHRHVDLLSAEQPTDTQLKDERRLYRSYQSLEVEFDLVEGKVYVQHLTASEAISAWVLHDHHFYFRDRLSRGAAPSLENLRPISHGNRQCHSCLTARTSRLNRAKLLLAEHGPLQNLELFSGAGGLGTGLDLSGYVKTCWAVEFSPGCAKTYAENHGTDTVMYNQCTNALLKHAMDCKAYEDGVRSHKPSPLLSEGDKTVLPDMPQPGEVDIITGGPPCQSFSGANFSKRVDDIRSTLPFNMLSYVEFYKPRYFILENVVGLLRHRLCGMQDGRRIVGGIPHGVLMLILRILITLGYQVSFQVLNAADYGTPQARDRLIILGARRGYPMPSFPIPTHLYTGRMSSHNLPNEYHLDPLSCSDAEGCFRKFAPFRAVTVNDAISDLPPFDWKNPHRIIPETRGDRQEVVKRSLPTFDATREKEESERMFPGYAEAQYTSPPRNRFQQAVRTLADGSQTTTVQHHYTPHFGAKLVERTVNIPMDPTADHKLLPKPLQVNEFVASGRKQGQPTNYTSIFGRLDGNGFFRTAMTTVNPSSKGARLLHPSQKRILTVRECARAQGFPDSYVFRSANEKPSLIVEDQHRQIGNAVPVPLAYRLGVSLGEALVKQWEREREANRESSPEL